jgi:hypothetical protein
VYDFLYILTILGALRLTFWLYATFQPAYKAWRSNAAGWNVPE